MSLTISPATMIDEPFLWEMLYQALHVPPGQPPFSREILQQLEIRQYLAAWGQASDFALIARINGQVVGAAWLRLLKGGYGYVDDATPELTVSVAPEWRGQGIGTQLLVELMKEARTHYAALSLSVSDSNPAARLYQRLGFEMVKNTGRSLTMRKEL